MNRRSAIKTGGMALVGLGFGGCRTVSPLDSRQPSAAARAPTRACSRVVGSRPADDRRPAAAPRRRVSSCVPTSSTTRQLIHNYGHAGAGMSLAWGCGILAAEFALQTDARRAAVIGCGSPGLTTARQLQRRGFDVTIYAMTVPPDTTSNMSLAGFTPTTALIDKDRRTPAWDAQFLRVAELSYRELQLMVGPSYGVYWMDAYNATDDPTPGAGREAGPAAAVEKAAGTMRRTPSCCPIRCGRIARANCSALASIRSRRSTRRGRSPCRSSRRSTSTRWCAISCVPAAASSFASSTRRAI